MTDNMVLAGDFPTQTREEWDREVLKVLNRKRPPGTELTIDQAIKRLTTTLVDGVTIDPLYTETVRSGEDQATGDESIGYPDQVPFTRGSELPDPEAPWAVTQLHEDGDVARTTAAILADLNAGATGVWLRVDPDAIAPADVPKVLHQVIPDAAAISVSSITDQEKAAYALLGFLMSNGAAAPTGSLGIDPIGSSAVTGKPVSLDHLKAWSEKAKAFPGLRAFTVDVTPYDNAGAGDIDQLAFAIATGIEYVRVLTDAGLSAAEAFSTISFRVAATADEFLTIARLRALRRLWARVGEVLEVPEDGRGAIQHVVTSWRMLSKDDPWVNVLRSTIATFSSAAGGAELITVLPHDSVYGLPSAFSRRVARNVQLVVAEEAHIGAVKDPAGGAWVFESLTDQVGAKAWARVQEIEALGGMKEALESGKVAEWITAVSDERNSRLATRKLALTGVSMFPKADEEAPTDFLPRPAAPAYKGLKAHRDAEIFEALRDKSRVFEKAKGHTPRVLLACLGERRDFGGREQFTSNLLLVGGLAFPELEGPSPDEIVKAAQAEDTTIVILASSTKVYAAQALDAAKTAKAAGLEVWLAGRKTEIGSDEADQYIDGEIFDGMNVADFLASTLEKLGA
ncbi:MAG: methylmalonyl-CoA mutase family protein [Propionibacteriaceae bacterium]|jgi:methylmalonyl-CoA mutase|nr:methylmalonyl-CoA mutase family protein [Propionibacteriaceae bacterium]